MCLLFGIFRPVSVSYHTPALNFVGSCFRSFSLWIYASSYKGILIDNGSVVCVKALILTVMVVWKWGLWEEFGFI